MDRNNDSQRTDNYWSWNQSAEHNLPRGQVLPGNPQPGMTSLLLFTYGMKKWWDQNTYPANAQVVCHSYQRVEYTNHFT